MLPRHALDSLSRPCGGQVRAKENGPPSIALLAGITDIVGSLASMVEIIYISTMKKPMHLNIKNDEAHKLASELADLTGESLTSAVTLALRERLARERRRPDRIAARLMKIGSRYAALADTGRSPEEILGYDEHGLPT